MTRINLLPWREMARKEKKRQFMSIGIGAIVLMGLIIFYVHIHVAGMISDQNARNEFINDEIARIDNQIKEIKTLEEEKANLVARMDVIQQLQIRRSRIVHIFDEIEKTLPAGVFLTKIEQKGGELVLNGVAQSNGDVSSLMRNLEASDWLESPRLEVIQSSDKSAERIQEKTKDSRYTNNFTVHVKQTGAEEEMEKEKSAKDKKDKEKKKA
ncbi:MAG: PilN domain-containing protein [Pseudomonadota bacterium]